MKEILEIINPVRVLKVEDWYKIAMIPSFSVLDGVPIKMTTLQLHETVINFIHRYESLTSQELRKSMFVCEVEEPEGYESYLTQLSFGFNSEQLREIARFNGCKEYHEAQSRLWFDGFESQSSKCVSLLNVIGVSVTFKPYDENYAIVELKRKTTVIQQATILDLIIEIDRYNRTAQEPIQINFTENFLNELMK